MKILYTLNSGQPGGMEYHVLDLVEEMTQRGHEVYVWCNDGPMVSEYKEAGAEVIISRISHNLDLNYIICLKRFLMEKKIDVIHAHEIKAVANSMLAGFIAKTKVRISHTHTPISEWRVPIYKKIPNLVIQFFVVWWFSSKEIALTRSRKLAKVKEFILEGKLEVIHNGVNIAEFDISKEDKMKNQSEIRKRFSIPENDFIFGDIGRLSVEKGHKILVAAFAEFMKANPNSHLLLAGGGPCESEIKAQINELGISNKISVTGRFPPEDHIKYYSTLDCFVHPTLAEGFGIVALEAMASEVPLLVSDLDVLQEVCADTAMYFEAGDSADLLTKMNWMYSNAKNLEILVKKAKYRVEELYSIKKFGDLYEKLYSEILSS